MLRPGWSVLCLQVSLGVIGWLGLPEVVIGQVALVEQSLSVNPDPTESRGDYSTQMFDHPVPPDTRRSQVWDNFVLFGESTIEGIQWWGGYDRPFNQNLEYRGFTDFLIQIHASSAGNDGEPSEIGKQLFSTRLPGGLAEIAEATDSFLSTFIPESSYPGMGSMYRYEANQFEPIRLGAGEYWLSIVAAQTFPSPDPAVDPDDPNAYVDPNWEWLYGMNGDDRGVVQDLLSGNERKYVTNDFAFALFSHAPQLLGDFNDDGYLSSADIDMWGHNYHLASYMAELDLDRDGALTLLDHAAWVEQGARTRLGDVDLNQRVEFVDFLALSSSFGKSGGWREGDFNGDGEIGFTDFLLLSSNFGYVPPAPTQVTGVPEPSSLSYLLMAILGWGRYRFAIRRPTPPPKS